MPDLGERLREQREALRMSQQALAEVCGISARSQRNYESGERVPDVAYLNALATAGADVLYVVTGIKAAVHTRLASVRAASEMAQKLGGTPEQMAKTQEAIFSQLMSAEPAAAAAPALPPSELLLLEGFRKLSLDQQSELLRQAIAGDVRAPGVGSTAVNAVVGSPMSTNIAIGKAGRK